MSVGEKSAVTNVNEFHKKSSVDGVCEIGSAFVFSSPQNVHGNVHKRPTMQKLNSATIVNSAQPCEQKDYKWKRPPVTALPSRAELGSFAIKGNSVQLDEEVLMANLKKFDAALVGRLFGKKIPFFQLQTELIKRWESHGQFRLVTITSDCFICYFNSIAARDSVLMSGPWVIAGQVLGLDKWSSAFSPSSMDGFVTPVWVRLPELPLYCWDLTNIARIVASLGEPLWVDAATDCMGRGAFARACVKLDLSKPLFAGVWVQSSFGKFYQRIEYEGLSKLCFRCGLVGHKEAACRYPPMSRATQPDEALAGEVQGTAKELFNEPMSECSLGDSTKQEPIVEGPGPWMVVQRRKRPTFKNQLKVPHNASQPKPKQPGIWMEKGTRVGGKHIHLHSLHATHQHALVVEDNSNSEPYTFSPSTRNQPSLCSKGNESQNQPMDIKLLGNGLVNDKPIVNMSSSIEPSPTHELECSHALVPYENNVKESCSTKERMSKSYADRMTNGLGPLVHGDRIKKRKTAPHNGGGDASPQKPP